MWTFSGSASVAQSYWLGNIPTNWIVAKIGIFDADLQSDIVWRDSINCSTTISLMDGPAVSQIISLGAVAPNWTIQKVYAN